MYDSDLSELSSLLETYSSHPVYILSGSGFAWYYSDAKRTMVRVSRGSECLFCEEDPENKGKYIVQIGSEIFSIPEKDLLEVGWN